MTEQDARALTPGDLVYHAERGLGRVTHMYPRPDGQVVVALHWDGSRVSTAADASRMAHVDLVLHLPPRLPL